MTKTIEQKIERIVELEMNKLDKALLSGALDQDHYDAEVRALDTWARETYREEKERF